MMHSDSVSGVQASLLNLKFSSHFICMSGSFCDQCREVDVGGKYQKSIEDYCCRS